MTRSTPNSARSTISSICGTRRPSTGWNSRSISPFNARRTIPGCASIRNGSTGGRTARSATPRTRRRNTRTSSMSISTPRARCPALWLALRDVVQFWVRAGRADLPRRQSAHQALAVLGMADRRDPRRAIPDVMFLAEAFTRPKMMYRLAKIGFSQSYTYFTWRNTKAELTEYLTELTTTAPKRFLPPAFLRQHAGHQPGLPADLRPRRLSDPRRAGGDAVRPLGHL